jgi:very-short-patch-repair endonuclease
MHDMRAFRAIRSVDEAIAQLASRSGGAVDRAQLRALGLGRGAIRHRLEIGRLRPLHHGVYAVGHDALPPRGRLVAGLLVAGPGAALSHRTAAGLWKLTPSLPQFVEITTTTAAPRSRPSLIFHQTKELHARRRHDLPVTTPIRTLRDLAATLPYDDVERACSEALVLRLTTAQELACQSGPGAAVLARIAGAGVAPTRSELERAFLRAIRKAGLPDPEVNYRIGRYVVDFAWPEQRVVVETDGERFHGHAAAIRRDHARDAELQRLGWVVLRFTWPEVKTEPAFVAARVARLLSRPARRRAS